jgi:hypothetical protein
MPSSPPTVETYPPEKRQRVMDARKRVSIYSTDDEIRTIKMQFQKITEFSDFHALLKEYIRFLLIQLTAPQCDPGGRMQYTPPYLIHDLWQAHILSTKEYIMPFANGTTMETISIMIPV